MSHTFSCKIGWSGIGQSESSHAQLADPAGQHDWHAHLLFEPHDLLGVCDAKVPHLPHHGRALLDSHLVALAAREEVVVLMLEVGVVKDQVLCKRARVIQG